MKHNIELSDMDELSITLPDGQVVNIIYDRIDEHSETVPQLEIMLPQAMTANVWPDAKGKNDPVVLDAHQIVIPVTGVS